MLLSLEGAQRKEDYGHCGLEIKRDSSFNPLLMTQAPSLTHVSIEEIKAQSG